MASIVTARRSHDRCIKTAMRQRPLQRAAIAADRRDQIPSAPMPGTHRRATRAGAWAALTNAPMQTDVKNAANDDPRVYNLRQPRAARRPARAIKWQRRNCPGRAIVQHRGAVTCRCPEQIDREIDYNRARTMARPRGPGGGAADVPERGRAPTTGAVNARRLIRSVVLRSTCNMAAILFYYQTHILRGNKASDDDHPRRASGDVQDNIINDIAPAMRARAGPVWPDPDARVNSPLSGLSANV
ncbi:hypothetical protein EVAR_60575_1 [Eumeta japonica]|uniref:Uncharacterized protein n=1 Tax=Eumeta variegata TaxID=151549 RepID=A0A4C1YJB2_EUMVA|nr:hypothetical protein EVAR_60575_1 [Eumeta japonica]